MKRAVSLLLCALLLASLLILPGCHGSRERPTFEVPESLDSEKSIDLTFWAKNDTNRTQTAIYEDAIQGFQELYPNVRISLRLYTDYGRIYNDVITNIATDTTPNICITYPDHIATYLTGADVVVALDELFTDARFGFGGSELRFDGPDRDELIDAYMDECAIGGVHYAVPFMRSTEACYVNKTYVEKLGYKLPEVLTWDFVWEVSEAAMAKDKHGNFKLNGQKVLIPFIYKSTDNMMIQLLRQSGAGYSTEEGEILLFNDTTRELLREIAGHVQNGVFSTFKISSYPANFLNAGQCLFAVDSTAGSTWMGSDAPLIDISPDKLVKFETAVYPVPQLDPENPVMISQGPSVCVFNKSDPQEVLASWLFAQYLMTNDVQIAYAETEGYMPVTAKAQNDPAYLDYLSRRGEDGVNHYAVKIDATRIGLENIENTFVTPVFNGSASLRDAAGQLIEDVTKSVRRKQTVDEDYLDKLFSDTAALYRLDQISAVKTNDRELGPLPQEAVTLLTVLAVTWALLALGALIGLIRRALRKRQ